MTNFNADLFLHDTKGFIEQLLLGEKGLSSSSVLVEQDEIGILEAKAYDISLVSKMLQEDSNLSCEVYLSESMSLNKLEVQVKNDFVENDEVLAGQGSYLIKGEKTATQNYLLCVYSNHKECSPQYYLFSKMVEMEKAQQLVAV
ncbi:hypothetical protein SFC65_19970 [Priestia filamentosa]|uniref:hypothetical protein n=1 Tax=Priestia filamentosa TaxID=1402861 RepID=UPI00398231C7